MGHDLTTVVLVLLGLFVALQIVVRVAKRLVHIPAPSFADVFLDSAVRRLWQPPAKIIERSGIAPGMTVLEVGCGGGAIARHVARALGPEGRLVALDIQAKMLARFRRKLDRPANRDIGNVTLVRADARELPFDDDTFDLVYAVTALPEVPNRPRALAEVKRVLRPGGVLAVTELIVDPDYPLRRTTIRLCTEAGLALDSSAGSFASYTVTFRKGRGDAAPARELPRQ